MTELDLRNVLAERAYPVGSVKVHLTEEPYFELAALERAIAAATTDTARAKATKAFEKRKAELDDGRYTVHLRGTSPRYRQDLQSEALHEVPIIRDMWGRENDTATVRRGEFLAMAYFAGHITKVVWPGGAGEQVWNDENSRELAQLFLDQACEFAIKTVDAAITALRGEQEAERYGQQDIDFLSHT